MTATPLRLSLRLAIKVLRPKSDLKKGRSGNPRGRPKESRNLSTVLSEVLNQPVTFKQSGKSKQLTKGDAVIRVLMNMGSKGDRRAADAVINLIGKIERLVDPPEAERKKCRRNARSGRGKIN